MKTDLNKLTTILLSALVLASGAALVYTLFNFHPRPQVNTHTVNAEELQTKNQNPDTQTPSLQESSPAPKAVAAPAIKPPGRQILGDKNTPEACRNLEQPEKSLCENALAEP